jgi:hypothetical protein
VEVFEKLSVCSVALGAVCVCAAGVKEVKVSSFGWDENDSTRYVQAALDSGARRVVFDRCKGPWIVKPLKARSHTEIVFEDGVELVAKKGEFRGIRECLLEVACVTNVSIVGLGKSGGVFRMHREEYGKAPYEPSEWRHALVLRSSMDIRVENMSFLTSGGDGICMGGVKGGWNHCRNVVIRRCVCDRNMRQGISVCGVKNLLIEDTVLKKTNGRLPKSGIDFEPDDAAEPIENCVMRRCRIEGNACSGIEIYLAKQSDRSPPIGITVEDCDIVGNGGNAVNITVGGKTRYQTPPVGSIRFKNCRIDGNGYSSMRINAKPVGFPLLFENCVVTNHKRGVYFAGGGWGTPMPDGVELRNLVVHAVKGEDWLRKQPEERGLNPYVPTNITGTVTVIRPDGAQEKVVLDSKWSRTQFALKGAPEMPPERVRAWPKADRCTVHDECPGEMVELAPLLRRAGWRGVRYAFFVDKPGDVHFTVRCVPSSPGPFVNRHPLRFGKGRYSHWNPPIAVLPPPGTTSETHTVNVPARGFYYMATSFNLLLEAADVPVAIDVHETMRVKSLSKGDCSIGLFVPPEVERFAFLTKDALSVEFLNPSGRAVSEIKPSRAWEAFQPQKPETGVWRIVFHGNGKLIKEFPVDTTGVPGLLWLSPLKIVTWY